MTLVAVLSVLRPTHCFLSSIVTCVAKAGHAGHHAFHRDRRLCAALGQGLTGLAFAYGADVSSTSDRAYVYGMLSATYQLTFTVSPYCGAILFEHVPAPAWGWATTLVFYLLGLMYIVFLLPEARSRRNNSTMPPLRAHVCGFVLNCFIVHCPLIRKRRSMIISRSK